MIHLFAKTAIGMVTTTALALAIAITTNDLAHDEAPKFSDKIVGS